MDKTPSIDEDHKIKPSALEVNTVSVSLNVKLGRIYFVFGILSEWYELLFCILKFALEENHVIVFVTSGDKEYQCCFVSVC